jgi:LEA14-like dessication related protein
MSNDQQTRNLILVSVIIIAVAIALIIATLLPQGPLPNPAVVNLAIISSNGSNVNGIYVIKGIVQNNNKFSVGVVNLNATGFDQNGKIINTGDGFTSSQPPLIQGAKSNFSISIYDPYHKIADYHIQIEDTIKWQNR